MGGMEKRDGSQKGYENVCSPVRVAVSGNVFPSRNEALHWGGQEQKGPGAWKGTGWRQRTGRRIPSEVTVNT